MTDAEFYARHVIRHLRWSMYYSAAALIVVCFAFMAMRVAWAFWFFNACAWWFMWRGRCHRRRAGI